ncbi:hypothetical protein P3X46_034950 [Hevea brasiliensis]|uniref:Uncharacterized protein n=1 Tax=Hevea brasiliensis TaxID=3981 RepID=A0ABQ9K740_HEVBR|nr:small rubber particle protein-like isoform X2 [Hevea brasiliensis]KAJ9128495.1 hypothetical protein P3X46_034950 [Hevea brasiliensis]
MGEGEENKNIQEEVNKEANIQEEVDVEEERLKYLDFVQTGAVFALVSFSKLYLFAKDVSGPFKPYVENAGGRFKSVVRPIYYKFQPVSNEILKFADHKVDESVTILDLFVPPIVKQLCTQAYSVARDAPVVACALTYYLLSPNEKFYMVLYGDG